MKEHHVELIECEDDMATHADPRAAPQSGGVYFLYGSDGSLLYIGRSVNLRRRLMAHFKGRGLEVLDRFSGRMEYLPMDAKSYSFILAPSMPEQVALEALLIQKFNPPKNEEYSQVLITVNERSWKKRLETPYEITP